MGVLDAIWEVETRRGRDLRPGDGGLAHGQIQQHEGHWNRGCAVLGVDWPWPQDTYDVEKCRHVALANWTRDAAPYLRSRNAAELIRRFRLPFAPYRPDNDAYLVKVLRHYRKGVLP